MRTSPQQILVIDDELVTAASAPAVPMDPRFRQRITDIQQANRQVAIAHLAEILRTIGDAASADNGLAENVEMLVKLRDAFAATDLSAPDSAAELQRIALCITVLAESWTHTVRQVGRT